MKKNFLIIALSIWVISATGQNNSKPADFNLGFEKKSVDQKLPDGWTQWGKGYLLSVDTLIKHSGKNSFLLEAAEDDGPDSFGCIAYAIPARYAGQEIELKAYMKLQDVSKGPIGLMLRIDGSSGTLQFDNMQQKNIMGTSDWSSYSVKLPYPDGAKTIYIGTLLSGKGKLWVDDFELLIDGIPIEQVKQIETKVLKADLDKEFDKGSLISSFNPTARNLKDLDLLGMIWGFLKYYHPNIAAGNFNWDYELFRIAPKIIKASNNADRDKILISWIKSLGDFVANDETPDASSEVKLKPDLDWISSPDISKDLSKLLESIRNAKRTEDNYYISMVPYVGNPVFQNERSYSSMKFPDTGFRLLALYRYWNMIQYFSPYKYLTEGDWKKVLEEFLPEFINASNSTDYELRVLELITRVHDTHANIWGKDEILTRYFGVNYAPYKVTFVENKPVITDFFKGKSPIQYSLKKGDEIVSINMRSVDTIISERLKITPASNFPTQLRTMASDLLRTNDSTITIGYRRDGKLLSAVTSTYSTRDLDIYQRFQKKDSCFKIIEPGVAYLYPGTIKNSYLPSIMNDIQNTKGLIIDLRCYPSEFVVFSLGEYLMPRNTPFVRFSGGSVTSPGLFVMNPPLGVGEDNDHYYKGEIVILVNEVTQSQAEYTTMALRVAPGAKVLGSTTAGADGNVSQIVLPGGIGTLISGIGVYYPDGKETQRTGIIPDVELRPTIKGIINNQDELLNKAIELIIK